MYTFSAGHFNPALVGKKCDKVICGDCANAKNLPQDRNPERGVSYCVDHNFTVKMAKQAKMETRPYDDLAEIEEETLMASDCMTIVSTDAWRKEGMALKIKIKGKMEPLWPAIGHQFTPGEINCFMQGYLDPATKFPKVRVRIPNDYRWELHPFPPLQYQIKEHKRKFIVVDEDEQDAQYLEAENEFRKSVKDARFVDKLYGTQKDVMPKGRAALLLDDDVLLKMQKKSDRQKKYEKEAYLHDNESSDNDMEGTDNSGSSSSADEDNIVDLQFKPPAHSKQKLPSKPPKVRWTKPTDVVKATGRSKK